MNALGDIHFRHQQRACCPPAGYARRQLPAVVTTGLDRDELLSARESFA
jgi:hypothetical protein